MKVLLPLAITMSAAHWIAYHTDLSAISLCGLSFVVLVLLAKFYTLAARLADKLRGHCTLVLLSLAALGALVFSSAYFTRYSTLYLAIGGLCLLVTKIVPGSDNSDAPLIWNEKAIKQQMLHLSTKPAMLTDFASALQQRFIIRQNEKTARERINFLRTTLDGIKLTKEMETSIDDLRFHEHEREIRRRELELRKAELEARQQRTQRLSGLEHRRDLARIRVEIGKAKKELADLRNDGRASKPKLTEEERRAEQRSYWEEEICRTQAEMKEKLARINDNDERIEIENMYQDALRYKKEQLRKHL